MRKLFFGILIGALVGSLGVVVAQTPTIFANIRVNGFSDLRGDVVNNTGDVTVDDNLVVTGTCTGCGGVSFPVLAPDGDFMDPSYSFSGHTASGLHWSAPFSRLHLSNYELGGNNIGIVAVNSNGVSLIGQNPTNTSSMSLTPTSFSVSGVFAGPILDIDLTTSEIETLGLSSQTFGYKGIPQNSQSGNYTMSIGDSGWHLLHPSGAGAGDTFTMDSDFGGSLVFNAGTTITFINADTNDLTIAGGTETALLAGTTETTPCTLAENGVATAILISANTWVINGTGLTCTP